MWERKYNPNDYIIDKEVFNLKKSIKQLEEIIERNNEIYSPDYKAFEKEIINI